MRNHAALRAGILIFVVATAPLLQATTSTQTNHCSDAFPTLQESSGDDWRPPGNIFGKSLPFMIPSAVSALILTQYLKHLMLGDPGAPVFSEAFPITVANDTLTTVTSHWISTSKLEGLKRFLDGRNKDGEIGFWRRVGANTLLNSALITLTWIGAGLEVGPEQACGALGLCAVVYPTLQVLKNNLYKRFPLRRDVRELDLLEQDFPEEVGLLRSIAADRAQTLGIDAKEAEFLLLTALEATLTRQTVETQTSEELLAALPELSTFRDQLLELNQQLATLDNDLTQLDRAGLAKVRQLTSKQIKLRRQFLNTILASNSLLPEESSLHAEVRSILSFGEGLSYDFSLALHRTLQRRLSGFQWRIALASVVDMSIAIGFFGGVCLEATNFWVKTGEIPPFLQTLLGIN